MPDDGEEVYMGSLVHLPKSVPAASDLIASLGLEIVDSPTSRVMKRSEPFGTTSVKEVFAYGEASTFMQHITQAMAQGERLCMCC